MSAREQLAVPPSPQVRGRANCGFCGQPWFGDVAYCPYCGRPSAGAPAGTGADAPSPLAVKQERATARPGQPGTQWKLPWITAAMAVAFVAIVIVVKDVAVTTGDRAGTGPSEASAAVPAPVAPDRGASASTVQAPRAEPVVPRADLAPPAPHRSLCSAANEAAGLCNPQ